MSHHDTLRVIAAPTSPHPRYKIRNQLKNVCKIRTKREIHAITMSFLCDCKNFCIGKFTAYANICGIIKIANLPAPNTYFVQTPNYIKVLYSKIE